MADALGRALSVAGGLRDALRLSCEVVGGREVEPANEFVGGCGRRAVFSDEVTGLRSVAEEIRAKGGPSSAVLAVEDALDGLRALVRERNAGDWDLRTVVALRDAVDRRFGGVEDAVNRYDGVVADWLDALPEGPQHVGVRIGERWYIRVRDAARLAGTTEDAARKYLNDHVKQAYHFGRLKYWDLEEVREAIRRRDHEGDVEMPPPAAPLPRSGRHGSRKRRGEKGA